MGNRALRKEVVRLMKEHGVPSKLYRKKHNRKSLSAHSLRVMIDIMKCKPGQVILNCDGREHMILSLHGVENIHQLQYSRDGFALRHKIRKRFWRKLSGYAFFVKQFNTDIGVSCGCDAPIDVVE